MKTAKPVKSGLSNADASGPGKARGNVDTGTDKTKRLNYQRLGSYLLLSETSLARSQALFAELLQGGSSCRNGRGTGALNRLPRPGDLPALAIIALISKPSDMAEALAQLHGLGVDAAFAAGPLGDFQNKTKSITHVAQSGLILPDPGCYLSDDQAGVDARDRYVSLIARVFERAGERNWDAAQHARAVLTLEKAMARASMERWKQKDSRKLTNKMSLAELQQLIPVFPMGQYFDRLGGIDLGSLNEINVMQPEYLEALDLLLTITPLADWKAYLRWHAIYAAAA